MRLAMVRLRDLPERDLLPLLEDSEREAFRFVSRVLHEWQTGDNRFAQPGEALFGAFDGDRLVGICGLMVDRALDHR